jgi:hypothetical protein
MRRRIPHRSASVHAQRNESVVCQIMEFACVRACACACACGWMNCDWTEKGLSVQKLPNWCCQDVRLLSVSALLYEYVSLLKGSLN